MAWGERCMQTMRLPMLVVGLAVGKLKILGFG